MLRGGLNSLSAEECSLLISCSYALLYGWYTSDIYNNIKLLWGSVACE